MRNSEDLVGLEGVDQHPAFPGAGLIQQDHPDVPDIVVDHIAKDQELNEGRNDQDGPVLFIPEKLDEFLPHQLADPEPVHLRAPPF